MREIPSAQLDFDKVRAYTNEYVNATSLRKAGANIGIGHSTLSNFLNGAVPHHRTRAILGAWYTRMTGDKGDPNKAVSARAVAALQTGMDIVVRFYPEGHRERVRANLVRLAVRECEASGLRVPAALAEEVTDGG